MGCLTSQTIKEVAVENGILEIKCADWLKKNTLVYPPVLWDQVVMIQISRLPWVCDKFLSRICKNMKYLKSVHITGCELVTDNGLMQFSELKRITEIDISDLHISGSGITGFETLKRLICRNSTVFDVEVCKIIRSCRTLKYLDVDGCQNITLTTVETAIEIAASREDNNGLRMLLDTRLAFDKRIKAPMTLELICRTFIEMSYYPFYPSYKGDRGVAEIVYKSIEPPENKETIPQLNDYCLNHIFKYLSVKEKIEMEEVCEHWKTLITKSWADYRSFNLSSMEWKLLLFQKSQNEANGIITGVLSRIGKYIKHIVWADSCELGLLSKFCPSLETVELSFLSVISASKIMTVLGGYQNLTEVIFIGNFINEKTLLKIFQCNQKLKSIRIDGMRYMTGNCLFEINPVTLESFHLYCGEVLSQNNFLKALSCFINLKSLSLSVQSFQIGSSDPTATLTRVINNFKNLKSLILLDRSFDDTVQCWDPIHKPKQLEKLYFIGYKQVTDIFLDETLLNCKLLTDIDISSCENVTDESLKKITILPELHTLKMSHIKNINGSGLSGLSGNVFRQLICQNCNSIWTAPLCHVLVNCPNLELLNFSGCQKVDERIMSVAIQVAGRRTKNVLLTLVTHMINAERLQTPPLLELLFITGWGQDPLEQVVRNRKWTKKWNQNEKPNNCLANT